MRLGYNPMIPWGGNARYDIGVDVDGRLIRIQCKCAWTVGVNAIKFKARSNSSGVGQRGYAGGADYFGVYSVDHQLVLYIPVDSVPVAQIILHFNHTSPLNRRVVQDYIKPSF